MKNSAVASKNQAFLLSDKCARKGKSISSPRKTIPSGATKWTMPQGPLIRCTKNQDVDSDRATMTRIIISTCQPS